MPKKVPSQIVNFHVPVVNSTAILAIYLEFEWLFLFFFRDKQRMTFDAIIFTRNNKKQHRCVYLEWSAATLWFLVLDNFLVYHNFVFVSRATIFNIVPKFRCLWFKHV